MSEETQITTTVEDVEQDEFRQKLFAAIMRAGGAPVDIPIAEELRRTELQREGFDLLSQEHERARSKG